MLKLILLALGLCQLALSDKTYWWDITWVNTNAGGFSRPAIGVNGHWPCPALELEVGERLTIFVSNKLGNESTSIHWHGLRQPGSSMMDGPSQVAQCPIPPGSTFTYSFVVDQPGTYWYHSHNMGQYGDGFRGPLIVRDPKAPYAGKIEKEYIVTLSDWYKKQGPEILAYFQGPGHFPPSTPIPDAPLMNDGLNTKFDIKPGKQYLFRIINVGAYIGFMVNFQGHNMTIVGQDGTFSQPTNAKTLYVGAAMRYDVIITGMDSPKSNYGILALFDMTQFEKPYSGATYVMGTLNYGDSLPAPAPYGPLPGSIMPLTDDLTVKPYDNQALLGPVTKQVILNFNFTIINGIPRTIINNITYLSPKVPSLYTALTAPKELKMDPRIYGTNTNAIPVKYGDIVEIVINNQTPFGHPWHLHGHQYQVVARSPPNATINGKPYDPSMADPLPMKRDVFGILPGGWGVMRFKADNPGVQLIHCHIEWHVEAGMTATILEATDHLHERVPWDHKAACVKQGIPLSGNAAGNTKDWLNLTGQNDMVMPNNYGALWNKPGGDTLDNVAA